jgi:hypothetical protein
MDQNSAHRWVLALENGAGHNFLKFNKLSYCIERNLPIPVCFAQ